MTRNKKSWISVGVLAVLYIFGVGYSWWYDKSVSTVGSTYITILALYIILVTPIYSLLNGILSSTFAENIKSLIIYHAPFLILMLIVTPIAFAIIGETVISYFGHLMYVFLSLTTSVVIYFIKLAIKKSAAKRSSSVEQDERPDQSPE